MVYVSKSPYKICQSPTTRPAPNNNHRFAPNKKITGPQVISERTRQSHKGDVLPSKFGHIAPGFVGVFGWWDSLALEVAELHKQQKRWPQRWKFQVLKKNNCRASDMKMVCISIFLYLSPYSMSGYRGKTPESSAVFRGQFLGRRSWKCQR